MIAWLAWLLAACAPDPDPRDCCLVYECSDGELVTVADAGSGTYPYEGAALTWDDYFASLDYVAAGAWSASVECGAGTSTPVSVTFALEPEEDFELWVPPDSWPDDGAGWGCDDPMLQGDATLEVTGWPAVDTVLTIPVTFATTYIDAKRPIEFAGALPASDPNGSGTVDGGYYLHKDGLADERAPGLYADLTYDSGLTCTIRDWVPLGT